MPDSPSVFVTDARRAWMRMRSHPVVFDRDPEFAQYSGNPSGKVITILRVWVAAAGEPGVMRHYLGSVRHCQCGGWVSGPELRRLFRQATAVARDNGEEEGAFRRRLSRLLREHLDLPLAG